MAVMVALGLMVEAVTEQLKLFWVCTYVSMTTVVEHHSRAFNFCLIFGSSHIQSVLIGVKH